MSALKVHSNFFFFKRGGGARALMWSVLTGNGYASRHHDVRRRPALRFCCHCQRGPSGVLVENVLKCLTVEVYHRNESRFIKPPPHPGSVY